MAKSTLDLGLLVLRLGVGGTLAAHGAQKLFGVFGGGGIKGTTAAMEAMGFRPGRQAAIAAGLSESTGALLALGAATPLAASAGAAAMVSASAVHANKGFFIQKGGYEYTAVLGLAAGALALTGPGKFSVDALAGRRYGRGWVGPLALAASLGASSVVAANRKPPAAS